MMFIKFSCSMNVFMTIVLLLLALAISNNHSPYLPVFLWHMIVLDVCKEASLLAKVILLLITTYFTFGYMVLVACGNFVLYIALKFL